MSVLLLFGFTVAGAALAEDPYAEPVRIVDPQTLAGYGIDYLSPSSPTIYEEPLPEPLPVLVEPPPEDYCATRTELRDENTVLRDMIGSLRQQPGLEPYLLPLVDAMENETAEIQVLIEQLPCAEAR